ncbi:hypothetical protein PINS_up014109 [Pythium insidiosum]|nr:hypothetical protein PINS_up014109 [Pythium insidiosum]
MRRALQRAKAGRILDRKRTHNEMVANVDRHMKVLTRYKIRRVTIEEDGTSKLSGLGFLMVNPHSTTYKLWQLVSAGIALVFARHTSSPHCWCA